jgi:hypothetical protein
MATVAFIAAAGAGAERMLFEELRRFTPTGLFDYLNCARESG